MKKLIPLIAVAIAMAIPLTISAQTTDYYGYENSDKTILIEWIEDAIDADYIRFDTQAHEDDFLDLIDDLYSARDRENWSGCVDVAGELETAAQYIVGEGDRDLVASICDCTGTAYTEPDLMVAEGLVLSAIQDGLINDNPGGSLCCLDINVHVPFNIPIKLRDGTKITLGQCTTITFQIDLWPFD